MIREEDRKSNFRNILVIGTGLLVGGTFLALVNYIQNGNPLRLAFNVYNPHESWGFSGGNHNIFKGIWNVIYSVLRIVVWSIPFLIELSIIGLAQKRSKIKLVGIIMIVYLVFFLGFFSMGGWEYGTRYFYIVNLLICIPASRGIFLVESFIKEKMGFRRFAFIIFFPACSIILLFFIYPHVIKLADNEINKFNEICVLIRKKIPPNKKVILFLTNTGQMDNNNYPKLDGRVVRALFLEPEKNRELLERFPDREPYLFRMDQEKRANVIIPYPKKLLESPGNSNKAAFSRAYSDAAVIYDIRARNPDKAAKCFAKAIDLDPGNISAWLNLAFYYYKSEKIDKAEAIYKEILKRFP